MQLYEKAIWTFCLSNLKASTGTDFLFLSWTYWTDVEHADGWGKAGKFPTGFLLKNFEQLMAEKKSSEPCNKNFNTIPPEQQNPLAPFINHPKTSFSKHFITHPNRTRHGHCSLKNPKQSQKRPPLRWRSPPVRSKTPGYFAWRGGPEYVSQNQNQGSSFGSIDDLFWAW